MSERQQLLERWAELEPERCKYNKREGTIEALLGKESWCFVFFEEGGPEDDNTELLWILLGALIEAVAAREWFYEIRRAALEKGHTTFVHCCRAVAASPADSLLAAYVAALESECGAAKP